MKKLDTDNPDKRTENSNVIETLKYASQDLIGNTYVINADPQSLRKIKQTI